MSADHYLQNPLIHKDRRLSDSPHAWQRKFSCEDVRPLVICRGPIRKEAMDVFAEMGIEHYGILLSEKDSFVYNNALAPELRFLTDPQRVFRVADYTGATKEERNERIEEIISIAEKEGYNAIFAGYGFMAEDEDLVKAIEQSSLTFIGPCAEVMRRAGSKDEAKRTALEVGVSVTPGIDNVTARTLLRAHGDAESLARLCGEHGLEISGLEELPLEAAADQVLAASYEKGIDLFSIDELGDEVRRQVEDLYRRYPEHRIRLKAIMGGGGKGQRILPAAGEFEGGEAERLAKASASAPGMLREILAEVKANGVGDNKNVLLELNVETTRHQEIQVVGNGDWCITMGGRDCSVQMHEQKLLEVSITQEGFAREIARAAAAGEAPVRDSLEAELRTLEQMENEAAAFGQAVGLDSVSTFECIVEGDDHYFMEMNTRIQVEHRVTELCYTLRFVNPEHPSEYFDVSSLVEMMVLLAWHGKDLPVPERVLRHGSAVEARLNATNDALQPHAGGVIEYWSNVTEGEIRDDQGISLPNPDTGVFMDYHLAGAYDSNIALLLATGTDREDCYSKLDEILRKMELRGRDLATNLNFHYGLVNWFRGQSVHAQATTGFVVPYLTLVGKLREAASKIDLKLCFDRIKARYVAEADQLAKSAIGQVMDRKETLLIRPLERLFESPHLLSGWLSGNRLAFDWEKLTWLRNPVEVLADLYRFVNMEYSKSKPAAYQIWDHDRDLLKVASAFYRALKEKTGLERYPDLVAALKRHRHKDIDLGQWQAAQAAHEGFQSGTELLSLLPYLANQVGFYGMKVNADLSVTMPAAALHRDLQRRMEKVLVPPPPAAAGEILAESGGMYYAREAPEMPPFVEAGHHFEKGDPLYIIEVMKMFNKVHAPFSGTIDKVLLDADGVTVRKGEPLFLVTPDEIIEPLGMDEVAAERARQTEAFLATVI